MDRNIRTLIVCFSIALMVLIPLRFVEAGQTAVVQQSRVLGKMVVEVEEEKVKEVVVDPARLESPYNEIDGGNVVREDCIDEDQAQALIDGIIMRLTEDSYAEEDVMLLVKTIENVEARVCE